MTNIELRFVEREAREQIETYVAIVRKVKILQYRHIYKQDSNGYISSEWIDVPLVSEEKEKQNETT